MAMMERQRLISSKTYQENINDISNSQKEYREVEY
jgi:hypothetical protein